MGIGWVKREWDTMWPLIRFEVYKWGWLLMGSAVLALGAKLLHGVLQIPDKYFYSVLFVLSFVCFVFLAQKSRRFSATPSQPQSGAQAKAAAIVPAQAVPNLDTTQYFRLAYYSSITTEVEKNIRLAAAQSQPDDKEGFFAKFIGVGVVAYMHDLTWAYIFRSQILMLMELNHRNGMMPSGDAKTYYDQAAHDFPEAYANYSFDQWLDFMISEQLLIRHPTHMLEITFRGRDFLKYLTHWGRYADARRF